MEGDQRFPRPHLEASLLQILKASNGACMFGLRRIGKSTLSRFVQGAMHAEGYTVVEVDAQGFRALDHLLFDILRALPKEHGVGQRLMDWATGSGAAPTALREALKQAAHGFGIHDATTTATITAYWQALADQIARLLRQDRPKLLLTIDEFPLMCKGIIEQEGVDAGRVTVNQLLAALRLWRDAGLRMLLTGSIGMAALERQYRLDPVHLNDVRPFSVPPLGDQDPTEPRRFVDALVRGTPGLAGWTEAHTTALLHESVALYPSFLQFAFTRLGPRPPPPDKFEEIFAREIRPELDDPFLDQFDVRLSAYRTFDRETAGIACDILARVVDDHPKPCPRAELVVVVKERLDGFGLAAVLNLLREDGFLVGRTLRDGAQDWHLSSALVLIWWKQRGLGRHR